MNSKIIVCLDIYIDILLARYFKLMTTAFSQAPFYTKFVRLPQANDPTPIQIYRNPRFYPWFAHAIGAGDGSHINCSPSSEERHSCRNRKGGVSINIFACCSFDLLFTYVLSGMEGSAADSSIFNLARLIDFRIPEGRYYLLDAGYGICHVGLVPYRGVRYHLAEWGRAGLKHVFLIQFRHLQAVNSLTIFIGQQTRKSFTTFGMLPFAILSSVSSESSRSVFLYCVRAVSTRCRSKHVFHRPCVHCTTSSVSTIPLKSLTSMMMSWILSLFGLGI